MSTPNPCLIHFPPKRIVNDEWCCLSLELYTFLSLRKFWLAFRKSKHEIANGEWCCWPPLAGIEEIKTRNSEWRMAVGTGENAVPKKTGFAHGFTIEWPECTLIQRQGLRNEGKCNDNNSVFCWSQNVSWYYFFLLVLSVDPLWV